MRLPSSQQERSALLSWDVTSIPPARTIEAVEITFAVVKESPDSYEFYEMKRPWVEGEATWNEYATGQSWEVAGVDGPLDRGSTVLGSMTAPVVGTRTISLNAAGVALKNPLYTLSINSSNP